ncbi:hypothetical protein [Rhizobium rhizogenes]|uniref:hypothetical protein n=1 Tax=Rhizobium rhizogenes TaxID=359 RepID=UPI001574B59C|nr:hypothetical protein [Rhizobium rhizogenes]NTF80533.1 hypothetical protein [Rhizobium rhizogenes]
MTKLLLHAMRGREFARAGSREDNEKRLVPIKVGSNTEMLPDDPIEIAKILTARKVKQTPAKRAKARMAAAAKKRGQ